MIIPIVKEPHPILHQRATPVFQVTPEIRRVIDNMIETMYVAEGVGLAANQIGLKWDILVASPEGESGKEIILLNARIIEKRGSFRSPEGCLSVPGVSAEVSRAMEVTVTGLDLSGAPVTIEAGGLLAKILQHETDHLQGHLYVDRLGFLQRQKVLHKYRTISNALGRVEI